MKLGEEDLESSIRKFMDVALCGGPLGERPVRLGTSAPLPELEANQLDLLGGGRDGLPLGLLSSSWGEPVGVRTWPTAPGPHLVPLCFLQSISHSHPPISPRTFQVWVEDLVS